MYIIKSEVYSSNFHSSLGMPGSGYQHLTKNLDKLDTKMYQIACVHLSRHISQL